MDFLRRKYISKCADIIRENFDIEVPIYDMEQVVNKLNGVIQEVEGYSFENRIIQSEDGGFIIQLFSKQSRTSRNFTIAQSLGHIFLHMGYMSNQELWDNYDFESRNESLDAIKYDEDEFATSFLMPKKQYMDYVYEQQQSGKIDTFDISRYFNVPNGVAVNRGKWLGALQW
ncbi:MAG: ImmA/IrrE family metallo-endopeptidase [Clostridia bacterium]